MIKDRLKTSCAGCACTNILISMLCGEWRPEPWKHKSQAGLDLKRLRNDMRPMIESTDGTLVGWVFEQKLGCSCDRRYQLFGLN
jgi:hypothetical protein